MISLDSTRRFAPILRHICACIVIICICSDSAVSAETLWDYLAQHNASVELMDIVPGNKHFFLAGVRTVIIPWDKDYTPEMESIIPPLQRKLLFVLNVNKSEQSLEWHREYPNLPDVHEVYSIASTANNQLCIVYGAEPWGETAINPLVLRLDTTGETVWFKPVFPSANVANSNFLPSERIANLDAINIAGASGNSCLVALITRSVQSQNETFRLHLIRYDSQGGISWHNILPTDLYGTMYLLTDDSVSRHIILMTNLSRDAALQAMILGQPFLPQIHIASIDSDGKILHNIDLTDTLAGAWLNDAIALPSNALLAIGKKGGAWLAHIQSNGQVLSEHVVQTNENTSDAFEAVASRGEKTFIIAHNGKISLFDDNFRLQSTMNITDITTHTYENPQLTSQLPADLAVEQLIFLSTNHYLLFYKYGSRITEIDLGKKH